MEKRINKTELLEFLSGNCSAETSVEVNEFLKTSVGQNLLHELLNEHWDNASGDQYLNEETLLKWKREWALKFENVESVESVESVEKIKPSENGPAVAGQPKTRKINLNTVFRYAAVFTALILGIGIYMVSTKNSGPDFGTSKQFVKKNPLGRHSDFKLSDGTHIYLGPGSALTFPEKFSGHKREVKLEGEAYFEVTKNKEKPFIIYTENIRTQVLGTTFKVTSFKNNPILVSVTSGRVRVDKINGSHVEELAVLYPGEEVSYNQQSEARKSAFNIENVKNWKEGKLVFDGTPLSELAAQISRWYNVQISISSDTLKKIPITVTLDGNMPLYKFLDVLSGSFGVNYKVENKNITIY